MFTRETYRNILSPIAEERIKNNQCPNCGKPKSEWNRRTTWKCCSVDCTKNFWKEHDKSFSWSGQRLKALRRDDFTCRECENRFAYHSERFNIDFEIDNKLEVDHIVPVCIGGASLDLDNLQTLCIECHKIKTKSDMKLIADYRKCERLGIEYTKQVKITT